MHATHHSPNHRCRLAALLAACTLALCLPVHAGVQFHWQDAFSEAEQRKLQSWLRETHAALEALVGELPMDTHLFIHRTQAREPVPWANTQRSSQQGVHFHVDPRFSLREFREDWTAPHELSHLILPYLGRENSWFAEGFASYMQYQVMQQMGVLSSGEASARYRRNYQRAARRYPFASQPFAAAAHRLRERGDYPTMYWGGAAYFQQVAQTLERDGEAGLIPVLRRYVACCRKNRKRLNSLVGTLDRLAGIAAFSERLRNFRTHPGFPQLNAF